MTVIASWIACGKCRFLAKKAGIFWHWTISHPPVSKDENGTWRCSNGIFKHEKCFRYFVTNFYFSPMNSPFKNYERCFLFYLKSSFRSWDIQIFLFPSSPFFLSVSHFFRAWSKINLEVYEVIICLNKDFTLYFAMSKNGQTHFKNFAAFAARFLKCAWPFYDTAN